MPTLFIQSNYLLYLEWFCIHIGIQVYTDKVSKKIRLAVSGSDGIARVGTRPDEPQTESSTQASEIPDIPISYGCSLTSLSMDQLRNLIPVLVIMTTKRKQPRWGHEDLRPNWWPQEYPFFNPKSNPDRQKYPSWKEVLQRVAFSCYGHQQQLQKTGN